MPRIVSFAWATPALLAGAKTVTRRDWRPRYAEQFRAGDEVLAYDRSPRYGGKPVARIRLTQRPYRESTRQAPPSDYQAEGFAHLEALGVKVDGLAPAVLWRAWHMQPRVVWVVRFELLEVLEPLLPPPAPEGVQGALAL